jgi:MoaA/NifB/PqqE/SkfB family radical SAM enzyme
MSVYATLRDLVRPPSALRTRLTAKRLANLYLARLERARGAVRLHSLPTKLTIEPVNACNLRCPACFTGIGAVGRARSLMSLDLYRHLLAELGDTLFELELCNWGEPLLHHDLPTMIGEATARGISTLISTNFSVPFDAGRAEALVRAGLTVMGVSLDGARQETYATYRVRGQIDRVLANCRLMQEAKRRLGSPFPRIYWSFHVFPHNTEDIAAAAELARGLDMELVVEKGWVVGEEWGPETPYKYFKNPEPERCEFLWLRAVVNNDGGVAPCCGSFYAGDDMGRFDVAAHGARAFRAVWNGPRFQAARTFYHRRPAPDAATADEQAHICYECPATVMWSRWQQHAAAGGTRATFDPGFRTNDGFNYFWTRRPVSQPEPRRAGTERGAR